MTKRKMMISALDECIREATTFPSLIAYRRIRKTFFHLYDVDDKEYPLPKCKNENAIFQKRSADISEKL